MATLFLEPGGDATFHDPFSPNSFWGTIGSTIASVTTDIVHGFHQKSISYTTANTCGVIQGSFAFNTAGRVSFYFYIVTLPSSSYNIIASFTNSLGSLGFVEIKLTSAGIIQLARYDTDAQIGTNGATLATGQWYRISLAWTITSTTVNRFELFVNGASSISITNATISSTVGDYINIGMLYAGGGIGNYRSSDHYVDNSNSLTDTGDIWVTAKRPVSNGTTNGFGTQIGSGGSGYGTGRAQQVNERPLSTTNGWSMVGAGSAVTEEYNVEDKNTGDIRLGKGTIIDYMGWVSVSSTVGAETIQIIVNGNNFSQSTTDTNARLWFKAAGSTTYPAGTGTDIGITTSTDLKTVSLYECGIVVAFIPSFPKGPLPPHFNN